MEDFEKIVDDCLEMDMNLFFKKGEYASETPEFLDIPDYVGIQASIKDL
ncbi:MAG: hypothetical protein ACI4DW_09105 [Lachnospiraceae bacterium]